MKQKSGMLWLVALCGLLTVWQRDSAWADNGTRPDQKLMAFFPRAKEFVEKHPTLTPDQIESIEEKLGVKLRPGDLQPTFYIALNAKKKPIGPVLFVDVEGPHGTIEGGVGLNMRGEVVKVEIYNHSEASDITNDAFLQQFIGKGVENGFQVGEDVQPVRDQVETSQAVAFLPQKVLLMTYALFAKKSKVAEKVKPTEETTLEIIPPVDLIELMGVMKDYYNTIRDYLENGGDKTTAVVAAKQLSEYALFILDFEPPKNPNETEEYTYFQQQLDDALRQFVGDLQQEGASDNTRKQWQDIVDLVNKAHLRFSVDEVDLDEDLK